MIDEEYHKRLTMLIGLFKEGEGRTPKIAGKAAQLVMIGIVNITEGYRGVDVPWDVEPEDEPADHATRALEKCQEVADGRKRTLTLAVTFYFVSRDKNRTPVTGIPGQKYAQSIEFTFYPEGGADTNDHAQYDLHREDARRGAAAQHDISATSRALDTLVSHCQNIANTFGDFMTRHEQAMKRADDRVDKAEGRVTEMHERVLKALDDKEDREIKRMFAVVDVEAKRHELEATKTKGQLIRRVAEELIPRVGDIAAVGSHALAQYAGKTMGIAPTPAQKSIMDAFKPIISDPVKLAKMAQAAELTEEEMQGVLNGISMMRQAEKMTEAPESAKRAMSGVRGPALTVAKFKMIPGVAEVFASANQTQANVAGTGTK